MIGLTLLATAWYLQVREESAPIPKLAFTDPYLIAYLRGGENEMRRIAVLSLVDRGLLETQITKSDGWLTSLEDLALLAPKTSVPFAKQPLERLILEAFKQPNAPEAIFGDGRLDVADGKYQRELERHGLLPEARRYAARFLRGAVGIALLVVIASVKTYWARAHDHNNVLLLWTLVLGLSLALGYLFLKRRTGPGDALIENLQRLFAGLKDRAASLRPAQSPKEVALLAAVYGIDALPDEHFPHVRKLYRRAADSGSNCGSSCGSSCGSCGGCGGCGGD